MSIQAPRFSIEDKKIYLSVTSEGIYDSPTDLLDITNQIHQKAKETGIRYFLLDFTRASFKLPIAEAYNLVRTYDLSMPAFAGSVAAGVYNEPSREFVKYWQEVGCQRGYTFELFKEISEAEAWLIKQVK
jgi:hypothetical protein